MPTLSSNPSYRTFINDRDKALEALLHATQKRVSDLSKTTLDHVLVAVTLKYRSINEHTRFTNKARAVLDSLYGEIDWQMRSLAHHIGEQVAQLRRATVTLSYAGELEATARVLGKQLPAKQPNVSLDHFEATAYAALTKLGGKIRNEIESGYVQEKELEEVLTRIKTHFPKVVRYTKPPRELKPLKEAFQDEWAKDATVDFIDDAEWANVLSLYKDEYVPKNRELEFDVPVKGESEQEIWYGWEIEQNITDDFVNRVKDGSVQAATEAGVSDFMWVAVLDDRTRPEHRLKNGLTSSEIEDKLGGEWKDFDDDSTVAPGGFNCRCRSVPYVADLPEVEPVNFKDFNEWLNS